ncbi:hypothetical protein RRG08_011731 [Elysia crispata]|uniref:Uncharacterized protein n=1 Tax=Elysia crispata TaxID=231223 RepID=A0AAE1AF84_9GAST|nr:hypothetical protein RRG08_011731 [Elysia crispata]
MALPAQCFSECKKRDLGNQIFWTRPKWDALNRGAFRQGDPAQGKQCQEVMEKIAQIWSEYRPSFLAFCLVSQHRLVSLSWESALALRLSALHSTLPADSVCGCKRFTL